MNDRITMYTAFLRCDLCFAGAGESGARPGREVIQFKWQLLFATEIKFTLFGGTLIMRFLPDRPEGIVRGLVISFLVLGTTTLVLANDNAGGNDKGTATFKNNCVVCHGPNGAGTALGKSLQAPDLRSAKVQKMPDAELAQTIRDGKKNMPGFKSAFSSEQIQALVKHVRELGKNGQSPHK